MKILKDKISEKSKLYIIAEIGLNHNGSVQKAIKMINFAKKAGCNAVKFQTLVTSEMMLKNTKLANYQKKTNAGNMYKLINKYNLTFDSFIKLKNYCDKRKITFLSTPFDTTSAIFLNKINVPAFKISSGDLDNFILLETVKKFKKPIILSTGMSVSDELNKTLKFLSSKKSKIAILHCISDYPTNLKDSQISTINILKKFKYPVGFSDHTVGDAAAIAAVSLGATIIEKHITLDNNMKGPDHKSSLECIKLKEFVKKLREINHSLKTKKRYLTTQEKKTKIVAKKSLYYKNNLKKNHKIKFNDFIALRPLANGISPNMIFSLINKNLKYDVKKYSIVKKFDFKTKA